MQIKANALWMVGILAAVFTWFAWFLPVWEGFDEPINFCYVQHVVEHQALPMHPNTGHSDYCSLEVESGLLELPLSSTMISYGLLFGQTYHTYAQYWAQHTTSKPEIIPISNQARASTHHIIDIWQGQHPPLPYLLLAIPYLITRHISFYAQLLSTRLLGIGICVLGVWVCWKSIYKILPASAASLVGLAWVAFSPMFFFHFGRITNESLTFLCFSLVWYVLIDIIQSKDIPRWKWLALGGVYALGILSKIFFVSVLPAVLLILGYEWFSRKKKGQNMKPFSLGICSALVLIAVPILTWTLQHPLSFVTPGVGVTNQIPITLENIWPRTLATPWLAYLGEVFHNFVGLFGWSFLQAPAWVYVVFGIAWGTVIFGIGKLKQPYKKFGWYALLFVAVQLLSMAWYNLRFDYLSITGGWYIYTLSAMLITLVALAVHRLVPDQYQLRLAWGVVAFQLAVFTWISLTILAPAYYGI